MNLELRGFIRFLPFLILPIFLIAGITGIIQAFNGDGQFAKVFMAIWIGAVCYQIIKNTKMVVNIRLIGSSKIIFKTILGKEYELYAAVLVSIKVNNNIIDFKTTNGNYSSLCNYDGFSEFVVAI